MLLLLLVASAGAHGTAYDLRAISAAGPHLWGATDRWGLVHSADEGKTWQWFCEEALAPPDGGATLRAVYDIEALPDGRALLAGDDGLLLLDPDTCGRTRVAGLPGSASGAYPIVSFEGWYLTAVYSSDGDGVMRCTLDACTPTELWAEDRWVRSLRVDDGAVRATTTTPANDGGLWRSTDGAAWTQVATWKGEMPDPRVLGVRGDRILLWSQGSYDLPDNRLLRSTDGGRSWSEVLSYGVWSDPAPSLLAFGGSALLRLGSASLDVWESRDDGATWIDVNAIHLPTKTLVCVSDDGMWVCASHDSDGFDVGRVVGVDVDAVACIDEAEPAACFAGSCDAAYSDFLERGAYGGGRCHQDLAPPPASSEGCGGGASDSAVLLSGLAWLARRFRPAALPVHPDARR